MSDIVSMKLVNCLTQHNIGGLYNCECWKMTMATVKGSGGPHLTLLIVAQALQVRPSFTEQCLIL